MLRRHAFLLGLLLELLVIFLLFVPYVYLMNTGTMATLRTVPVDPLSIFRGNYVQLAYEAGQLPEPNRMVDSAVYESGPRYVVLTGSGDVYVRKSVSETLPVLKPGEICLRGRQEYSRIEFPDIAQYFADAETAKKLETDARMHRLFVDISVSKNCKAVIRGVHLGPEVPESELPRDWMPTAEMPVEKPVPVR